MKQFLLLPSRFSRPFQERKSRRKNEAHTNTAMNDESFRVASTLINAKYIDQSHQAIKKRQKLFQTLLSQRCMPEKGWDNVSIQAFIDQMSQMDCNNQLDTVGVGEREGRVFSSLVASRHFYLAHGVGRSGDLTENQPKASGSSLISALCNHLVKHALKLAGVQQVKQCLVVPMCTGMTLSLVLRSLFLHEKQKQQQGEAQNSDDDHRSETRRKYVIWSRIDQKSCLKCIQTAGFEPIVIENVYCDQDHENEDGLCTNLAEMELQIERLGAENILCVLSTTSCFAPRLPDKVVAISKLCKKYDIGHIVNNAYGVQCKKTMSQISAAMSQGRLDAFIQSTDKNFMVPVGGSIVASNNIQFMNRIASTYAGRASITPILDLFITLLSMGVDQWTNLLQQRMVCSLSLMCNTIQALRS